MSIEMKQLLLKDAMQFIVKNKVSGDYFEFGVFEGRSFISAYNIAQSFNLTDMHFYAFDSFLGLPSSSGHFKKGQYYCSRNKFEENLRTNKLPPEKYTIIEGWFGEVLPETRLNTKTALVYVDCDIYISTVSVLDFIISYLQKGTIIGFDEWYSFPEGEGESKAFKEWIEKNPNLKIEYFMEIGTQGKSFKVVEINE